MRYLRREHVDPLSHRWALAEKGRTLKAASQTNKAQKSQLPENAAAGVDHDEEGLVRLVFPTGAGRQTLLEKYRLVSP